MAGYLVNFFILLEYFDQLDAKYRHEIICVGNMAQIN